MTRQRLNFTVPLRSLLDVLQLLLRNAQARAIGIMTELLVPGVSLGNDDLVCLSYRPDLEQTIHVLEWNGLGLWHEEPDEHNAGEHHGGEKEEYTAAARSHSVEHLGREARDDKVPEPVVGYD